MSKKISKQQLIAFLNENNVSKIELQFGTVNNDILLDQISIQITGKVKNAKVSEKVKFKE